MHVTNPPGIDIIGCDTAETLPGLLLKRAERSPDAIAYSEHVAGTWQDVTWTALLEIVRRYRRALDRAGMAPGDRVALMLPNCVDWIAFDLAAMANGLITVPLYPHDSSSNIATILAQSGARLCLIGDAPAWKTFAPALDASPGLQDVWQRSGEIPQNHADRCRIRRLADVLDGPPGDPGPPRCRPQDIATLIHTSGTTGTPKGAMLTHRALLWDAEAVTGFIPPLTSDVFLSLLPLAHAFERTMTYHLAMMCGARVVFARSIKSLRRDLLEVRPTVLVAVPRLYERLLDAIRRKTAGSQVKSWLAQKTAAIGWQRFEAAQGRAPPPGPVTRLIFWPLLDRLVAGPVLAAFGGRLRVAVSGGAPLSPQVSHTLIGLGLPLVEGYGLTEAAPVVTATTLQDNLPGSVGRPLAGVTLRLAADQELLVKSPALMNGYWDDPAQTAEAIDGDGWLHTGDIAEIDDGRVFITGRIKDLIVLSTGKNIAAGAIEALISADPVIEQCCVLGDKRAFLCAVVVLGTEAWREAAGAQGLDASAPNAPESAAWLLSRIAATMADQPAYARVRAVHAVLDPWTVEDGSLTPTLKIKRQVIAERYGTEIDALYARSADRRRGAQ